MKTPKYLVPPLLAALLLLPACLHAQNRLVPADSVATLRQVWQKQGKRLTADRYGQSVWGGVDLNGDSIGDFAVYRGSTSQWYFYAGGNPPDTAAFWVVDSVGRSQPLFGDFHGDGRITAIFIRGRTEIINGSTYYFVIPSAYWFGDTGLSREPYDTNEMRAYLTSFAIELNGRPGLEYIVTRKFNGSDQPGYIEIYEGGDNFQIREPNIVIADTGVYGATENAWEARFADFDGDGYMDMLTGGGYPGAGELLRFYFGDENSPQSWTERDFDRTVTLEHGVHGINNMADLHIFDANGDGATDLGSWEYEDLQGNRLYLTAPGRNARTRSFTLDDADVLYEDVGILLPISAGYINDSLRSFEPILFHNSYQPDASGILLVSGATHGPDHDYDASFFWSAGSSSPIGRASRGVRDVTGDGWDDFIGASGTYGVFVPEGIVTVFAGGPYIPLDDPTLSVREVPVAGESGGLFLWPNPVNDELHIAWRGDLRRMPTRFEVFDAAGRSVVQGDVLPARGEAVWFCADVPTGRYFLVGYDASGEQIAAEPVLIAR